VACGTEVVATEALFIPLDSFSAFKIAFHGVGNCVVWRYVEVIWSTWQWSTSHADMSKLIDVA
jgi:hypothetical protein